MKPLPMVHPVKTRSARKRRNTAHLGTPSTTRLCQNSSKAVKGASSTTARINPISIYKCGTRRSISAIATRPSSTH